MDGKIFPFYLSVIEVNNYETTSLIF